MIDHKSEIIISKREFIEKKPWLEQYKKKINKDKSDNQKPIKKDKIKINKNATITMECPNCHHPELYFTTAQTRSADEGTTVYYECVKCE